MAELDPTECIKWVRSAGSGLPVPDGRQLTLVSLLNGLEAVAELRGWLAAEERRLVTEARKQPGPWQRPLHTWEEIAAALDEPKASVHRRHGNSPPR